MLTVSSGHSASYLTDAVAAGRENYYSGAVTAGEPPGRWYGEGATALGLTGLVDPQDMTAVYERFIDPRDPAFRDPSRWDRAATLGRAACRYITEDQLYKAALDAEPNATPERQAELRLDAGKRARRNVAFIDVTFSVQKSITVLHTAFEAQEVAAQRAGDVEAAQGWAAHRTAVEDAIWAGNNAALDYLARQAGYSRIGHHGGAAGRYIDAHELVVASFFQHDSRDHDPQLHIHNAILNRVQGADGIWRTIDGRSVYRYRGAAGAIAERTTESHLTTSLGVAFATRPDGKAREILGVPPEVVALFSSRRRAITAATAELVTAFESRFERQPNALELDRLRRQATFATRRAKSSTGETLEERLDRWDRALRAEVATGLAGVARDVLACASESASASAWERAAVLEIALADVQSRKSAWTRPDLTRAVSDALPDSLGSLSGDEIATLLDGLSQDAVDLAVALDPQRPGDATAPDDLRLANGRSAYDSPGGALYATPAHVHTERLLVAASTNAAGPKLSAATAERFIKSLTELGIELAVDQATAVRGVLTSGSGIETLVGPAGTGKSFVLGVLARAWTDPNYWDGATPAVVGLASSQIATEVLATEGLAAMNITRWLAAQRRLGVADHANRSPSPQDEAWRLRPGDLVVIDESAMTATSDIAAVHSATHRAGAKLLLTGDHRQLAAVGAGGGMSLMASAGRSYELSEARRFVQGWEAEASLQLRSGDSSALGEYYKHGRLRDCGTDTAARESAATAWLADTLAGQRSLLIVATNEEAAQLSARLRAELVRLGHVEDRGVPLDRQGTTAGVGDLVQARANGWHLVGHAGNRRGPINRELLRVLAVHHDGGLLTAPVLGHDGQSEIHGPPIALSADYVRQHLALGYATTAHAAQGLTVDTAHVVATSTPNAAALYVGLTRGRAANTAHVATLAVADEASPAGTRTTLHRSPAAVLAVAFESARPDRAALEEAAELATLSRSLRSVVELLADASAVATAERAVDWLDRLVVEGLLHPVQRSALAAEDGASSLTRLLRRVELAGHDPLDVLRGAVTARHLRDARQITNVLHHRITTAVPLEPVGDSFSAWLPRDVDRRWQPHLQELASLADAQTEDLGRALLESPPAWAIETLGAVPADPAERARWAARAGVVAAQREISGFDDPQVPLGTAPAPGKLEHFASWRAACRAVGRDEAAREEAELTNGQLRIRVRAWEREQAWAPAYVADELAATAESAAAQRTTAILRRAEANAVPTDDERDQLLWQAADAEAVAAALEARARALEEADQARALWYAHTSVTRTAAERAADELDRRCLDAAADPPVTAEEWLALQRAAQAADEVYRDVDSGETEPPSSPQFEKGGTPETAAVSRLDPAIEVGPLHADLERALAATRVPSARQTSEVLAQARRALVRIVDRESADRLREAEEAAIRLFDRTDSSDLSAERAHLSELIRGQE
ncbi:MobF family relaxase [Sporichthya brevicatena]